MCVRVLVCVRVCFQSALKHTCAVHPFWNSENIIVIHAFPILRHHLKKPKLCSSERQRNAGVFYIHPLWRGFSNQSAVRGGKSGISVDGVPENLGGKKRG